MGICLMGRSFGFVFFTACKNVSSVIHSSNHKISSKLEESVMEFVEKGSEIYLGDLPDKP
jgi:elongation factor P hydroxylase